MEQKLLLISILHLVLYSVTLCKDIQQNGDFKQWSDTAKDLKNFRQHLTVDSSKHLTLESDIDSNTKVRSDLTHRLNSNKINSNLNKFNSFFNFGDSEPGNKFIGRPLKIVGLRRLDNNESNRKHSKSIVINNFHLADDTQSRNPNLSINKNSLIQSILNSPHSNFSLLSRGGRNERLPSSLIKQVGSPFTGVNFLPNNSAKSQTIISSEEFFTNADPVTFEQPIITRNTTSEIIPFTLVKKDLNIEGNNAVVQLNPLSMENFDEKIEKSFDLEEIKKIGPTTLTNAQADSQNDKSLKFTESDLHSDEKQEVDNETDVVNANKIVILPNEDNISDEINDYDSPNIPFGDIDYLSDEDMVSLRGNDSIFPSELILPPPKQVRNNRVILFNQIQNSSFVRGLLNTPVNIPGVKYMTPLSISNTLRNKQYPSLFISNQTLEAGFIPSRLPKALTSLMKVDESNRMLPIQSNESSKNYHSKINKALSDINNIDLNMVDKSKHIKDATDLDDDKNEDYDITYDRDSDDNIIVNNKMTTLPGRSLEHIKPQHKAGQVLNNLSHILTKTDTITFFPTDGVTASPHGEQPSRAAAAAIRALPQTARRAPVSNGGMRIIQLRPRIPAQYYGYSNPQGKYQFSYSVSARETQFGHEETRNAGHANGTYYTLMPDGRRQVVTYYADESGFHPVIRYEAPFQIDPRTSGLDSKEPFILVPGSLTATTSISRIPIQERHQSSHLGNPSSFSYFNIYKKGDNPSKDDLLKPLFENIQPSILITKSRIGSQPLQQNQNGHHKRDFQMNKLPLVQQAVISDQSDDMSVLKSTKLPPPQLLRLQQTIQSMKHKQPNNVLQPPNNIVLPSFKEVQRTSVDNNALSVKELSSFNRNSSKVALPIIKNEGLSNLSETESEVTLPEGVLFHPAVRSRFISSPKEINHMIFNQTAPFIPSIFFKNLISNRLNNSRQLKFVGVKSPKSFSNSHQNTNSNNFNRRRLRFLGLKRPKISVSGVELEAINKKINTDPVKSIRKRGHLLRLVN
ncbi:unnamed protein product [Meganyctiphanes norvegica]|uniref:Uncharacterized protein n=1 Tax=Meganyctiphanes norvegica TaxID=48144 RepID=A0AAV2PRJ2_MEGNR